MSIPDWDADMIRRERARITPGTAYRTAPDTWLRVCPQCDREETTYGQHPGTLYSSEFGRHLAYDHGLPVGGLNVGMLP